MIVKEVYPKNMYQVKSGSTFAIVKCNDQDQLEEMIKEGRIDEYRMLKVFKLS